MAGAYLGLIVAIPRIDSETTRAAAGEGEALPGANGHSLSGIGNKHVRTGGEAEEQDHRQEQRRRKQPPAALDKGEPGQRGKTGQKGPAGQYRIACQGRA